LENISGNTAGSTFGSRLNGDFFLTSATLFNDGAGDALTGESGQDWFVARSGEDTLGDRNGNEVITSL
jgi:hypothetical protein